jgi:hypothetical protein
MIQLNDDLHENLTLEALDRILDAVAARTPAPPASAPHLAGAHGHAVHKE